MALINCPDCGKAISDAAPACIHCGRPADKHTPFEPTGEGVLSRSLQTSERPSQVSASAASGQPRCNRCGSSALRALSVLHRQGVKATSAIHVGTTLGDGNADLGVATSSGTEVSKLAGDVAPPAMRQVKRGCGFGCAISAGVLFLAFLMLMATRADAGWVFFALIVTAVAGLAASETTDDAAAQWNRTEFPKLMEQWESTAMCLTCGARQTISPSQSS